MTFPPWFAARMDAIGTTFAIIASWVLSFWWGWSERGLRENHRVLAERADALIGAFLAGRSFPPPRDARGRFMRRPRA